MEPDSTSVIGSDLIALANQFSRWIPRREERFEYVNHAIVRRTVRVDIDLEAFYTSPSDAPQWRGMVVVPVAVIRRDRHTTFDVRAEDGSLLPRLTAFEERTFVYRGAVHHAAFHLGRQPEQATRDAIYRQIFEPPNAQVPQSEELARLLTESNIFRQTLSNLQKFYYLLVPLDTEHGLRRVVTYSYLEPIVPQSADAIAAIQSAFPSDAQTDRVGSRRIDAEVAGAGDCRSYHLEVVAPPALRLLDVRLRAQEAAPNRNPHEAFDNDRLETHAHMHMTELDALAWGAFTCRMSLSATGIVRAAVAASLFALVTLVGIGALMWLPGVVWFVNGDLDQSASTSFFLLVPGLVGPALAATSNHGLTTSLLLPTRLLMWLTGAASFIVAGAVAVGLEGGLRLSAWLATIFHAGPSLAREKPS